MEPKMGIQVMVSEERQIIKAVIQDDFNWTVMEELIRGLAGLINEVNSYLILVDFRAAKMSLSVLKIFQSPEKVFKEFEKNNIDARKLKRALVVNEISTDIHFFETVSLNNMQHLRVFFDENSAREWLLNEQED